MTFEDHFTSSLDGWEYIRGGGGNDDADYGQTTLDGRHCAYIDVDGANVQNRFHALQKSFTLPTGATRWENVTVEYRLQNYASDIVTRMRFTAGGTNINWNIPHSDNWNTFSESVSSSLNRLETLTIRLILWPQQLTDTGRFYIDRVRVETNLPEPSSVEDETTTFKYNISAVEGTSLERVYSPIIRLEDIIKYRITATLNDLLKVDFDVRTSEYYINNLILERSIAFPGINENGIITRIQNKETILTITGQEFAWHLKRKLFNHDSSFEFEETDVTIDDILDDVIDSANNDPDTDWVKGEDIADGNVSVKGKYKSHLEVLQLIARNSGNDLWFRGNRIYIGRKGKTINVSTDKYFIDKLSSDIDLDKYANKVHFIGKDTSNNMLEKVATENVHNFDYEYERAVVNTNVIGDDSVQAGADRVLGELKVESPFLTANITNQKFKEYDIETGDILKIVKNFHGVKFSGFYKVVKYTLDDRQAKLTLEFSEDGKFNPRLLNASDLFDRLLTKIKDIELEV